ncbi:hypothetical protein B6U74_04370 [Candidatus Bathyarchaeota archaeon ex4484_205]|nr:MAG: hypothetical protein B6U74_04370 [Candidatus Bathyarchaeota archaeon ex4484_205]RLG67253.1 MAG: hypothetical protein DRN93_04830 [archaeon]
MEIVIIVGHRGDILNFPENTIPAFESAISAGVDYVEFDVRKTRDGVLIIMHDENVQRTTDGVGKISEMRYEEVAELDAGSWFDKRFEGLKVPTLEETLRCLKDRCGAYLEIKVDGIEEEVIQILEETKMVKDTLILDGNDVEKLKRVRKLSPFTPTEFQAISSEEKWIDMALEAGSRVISIHKKLINRDFVEKAHFRCLLVTTWPLVGVNEVLRAVNMGVDHLVTDDPWGTISILRNYNHKLRQGK